MSSTRPDFGTGYSSLSYLREFPFDVNKIAQNFVAHLPTDKATRSIVSAMIDLSHVLGLSVTAEGVETADQFALVASLGADDAQGFYVSKPLTAPQLTDYPNTALAGADWALFRDHQRRKVLVYLQAALAESDRGNGCGWGCISLLQWGAFAEAFCSFLKLRTLISESVSMASVTERYEPTSP